MMMLTMTMTMMIQLRMFMFIRNSIPPRSPNHPAPFTIPKTNSSTLKDGGWVSLLSFWQSLFSGAILGAIQLGRRKQGAPKRCIEHFMYPIAI